MENEIKKLLTLPVLGGAYKAGTAAAARALLTHLGYGDDKAACGRAKNLADKYSITDEEKAARPTCPICAKKWDRLNGVK